MRPLFVFSIVTLSNPHFKDLSFLSSGAGAGVGVGVGAGVGAGASCS